MKVKFFLAILIVILIISNAISLISYRTLENTTESISKSESTLTQKNDELEQVIQKLKTNNESLNNKIESLGKEKSELEGKIKQLNITKNNNSSTYIGNTGEKIAYLTFDDGPSKNTPHVLDILKKNDIKATFFVNSYGSKEQYQRIVNEGHMLGNHTFSHDYKGLYSTEEGFMGDVNKLNNFLYNEVGVRPNIFRFPGGSNNTVSWQYGGKTIMKKLTKDTLDMGYQYFDWNVDSQDASGVTMPKDVIVESVLKQARTTDHAIILMHDSIPKTTTVDALPEIIANLKDLGFKFDIISKDTRPIHFEKP